jgi:hypothetical protein
MFSKSTAVSANYTTIILLIKTINIIWSSTQHLPKNTNKIDIIIIFNLFIYYFKRKLKKKKMKRKRIEEQNILTIPSLIILSMNIV